ERTRYQTPSIIEEPRWVTCHYRTALGHAARRPAQRHPGLFQRHQLPSGAGLSEGDLLLRAYGAGAAAPEVRPVSGGAGLVPDRVRLSPGRRRTEDLLRIVSGR